MVRQHSTSTDLFAHFPLMLRDMGLTDLKHMMFSSYNLAKKEEEAESRSRIKTAFGLEEPFYLE